MLRSDPDRSSQSTSDALLQPMSLSCAAASDQYRNPVPVMQSSPPRNAQFSHVLSMGVVLKKD